MKVCTECNVFLIANSEFEEQDGCGPISFLYTHALLLYFLEVVRRTGLLVEGGGAPERDKRNKAERGHRKEESNSSPEIPEKGLSEGKENWNQTAALRFQTREC